MYHRRDVCAALGGKIHPFWLDRALDMIEHICGPNNYHHGSAVKINRVCKEWPQRGSIMFTRLEDGRKFRAYMTKDGFKVKPA